MKKNKNMGILKFSLNRESLVYFDNKPSLNLETGVWNPFLFSFHEEEELNSFCNNLPQSFIIERILSDGFVIESYNFMVIDEIVQTGDGISVIIYFKSCALLN